MTNNNPGGAFEQGATKEAPKQEQKTDNFNDVLLEIEKNLDCLDFEADPAKDTIGQAEQERVGYDGIKKQAGLGDRFRLLIKQKFSSFESFQEKVNSVAEKSANENLNDLESGLGAEIIGLKEKITQHEKNMRNDLAAISGLKDLEPSLVEEMSAKLQSEKDDLEMNKVIKERELEEQVSSHPIFERQERINNLLGNYQEIKNQTSAKRQELSGNIRNYEATLRGIKGESDATADLKARLSDKLKTLKEQQVIITGKDEEVKSRIRALQQEQKGVQAFTKRMNSLGKTKSELLAEQTAARKNSGENKLEVKPAESEFHQGAEDVTEEVKGAQQVWKLHRDSIKNASDTEIVTDHRGSGADHHDAKVEGKNDPEKEVDKSINKKTGRWINDFHRVAQKIINIGKKEKIDFDQFFKDKAKTQIISAGKAMEILGKFLQKTGQDKNQAEEYIKKII